MRRGNCDQIFRALVYRLIPQIGNAIFGNHKIHVGPSHTHHRVRLEPGHYARHLSVLGGRRQSHNREAAGRQPRAAHEIGNPAGAAHLPATNDLGIRLAKQIDLDDGIDRDEGFNTAKPTDVVGPPDGCETDSGIVGNEVVESVIAERHARRDGGITVFDCSEFDETQYWRCDGAGMQPKTRTFGQFSQHALDPANADLQGCAIGNPCRYMLANRLEFWVVAGAVRQQRMRCLDHIVQVIEGDGRSAEGARHMRIDVRYFEGRLGQYGRREIVGDTQAAKTFGVRRRDMKQRNVDTRNIAQIGISPKV